MTSINFNLRTSTRANRFYDELVFALARMERNSLKGWGRRSSTRLLLLAGRRVGGLARLATLLARTGGVEILGLLAALRQQRIGEHLGDRTASAIDSTLAVSRESRRLVVSISRGLIQNPKAYAPAVLGAIFGFGVGSGGLDGDGGIPDLDLLAGIGAHRSPLTHSIIAGIVIEGILLTLADLAADVHGKLPHDHDPLWDSLAKVGRPLTESLAIGTSVGLAYHLLIDALVQPGAYHGLPIEMPIEAHQVGLAVNGVAEGADAATRADRHRLAEIVQGGVPEKSAGRKTVDAVAGLTSRLTAKFGRTT